MSASIWNSRYTMTINGKAADSRKKFPAYNPATEKKIAAVPDASRKQLDAAVAAARKAFPSWSALPASTRGEHLNKIADLMDANSEEFMSLLTREQGKSRDAAAWEIGGSVAWCRELAKQRLPVEVVEDSADHRVETRRTPLGVVGAIVPWNFPVLLAIWKIGPALMAGNTVVVKPSPFTPLCTLKLGELLRGALPAGVVNIVSGGDNLGKWMTTHPGISKISFTGSTETGKRVMQSAAANLKRVTLELGGNDPAIVMKDVDAKALAPQLFWTAFANSSQFCVAAKRMYVHDEIYDEVAKELVEYAKTVKVGDCSDASQQLGPIQNKMQYKKVKNLIADSKRRKHKFLLGGEVDEKKPGYFIPVTIIDNPPESSRVVREEAFGPVLPLLRWKDEDDVVRRANDTDYGLAATVWGKDASKAAGIAARIEAGTVWVNEAHVFAPNISFGGHKQSGMGVENAIDGLMEYTNPQTIMVRKKS